MQPPKVMARTQVDSKTLEEVGDACSVSVDDIEDVYACTATQIGCIYESTTHANRFKHIAVVHLAPSVDLNRLASTLERLVSINAVLRTRIVNTKLYSLVQVVLRETHRPRFLMQPLDEYMQEELSSPMSLGQPLLRTAILDNKLVVTIQHAIRDGWSMGLMLSDLHCIYEGREPGPRPPFKDFVHFCHSIDDSTARKFWAEQFSGPSTIFPEVRAGHTPRVLQSQIRRVPVPGLGSNLSRAQLPPLIESAWALTAYSYTNARSVAFGLVFSGRTLAFHSIMGPTIAAVPVQVIIDPASTIQDLVRQRSVSRRGMWNHPATHYGQANIRRVSEAAESASKFQTLLTVHTKPLDQVLKDTDEMRFERPVEYESPFALSLNCWLDETDVIIQVDFDPATIHPIQMRRVLAQLENILLWVTQSPPECSLAKLPVLSPNDRRELLEWNQTVPSTVEKCLHDLVSFQARQRPSGLAVDSSDGSLTYRDLDEMSDRLGSYLRARGVLQESYVPFLFEKSIWAVVALLGILKAGGICVPIDLSYPHTRKEALITRVNGKMLLASSSDESNLLSTPSVEELFIVNASSISSLPPSSKDFHTGQETSPAQAAYVLFTSGSTGTPKGVVLEHRNLASTLTHYGRRVSWQPGFRILQFSAYVWDTHTLEILGTLIHGGCVCVPTEDERRTALAGFMRKKSVDWAILTPTVMRTISPDEVPGLKTITSCGEPVDPAMVKLWSPTRRFINEYGPCEVSGRCLMTELTTESPYSGSIGTVVDCAVWIVSLEDPTRLAPIGKFCTAT